MIFLCFANSCKYNADSYLYSNMEDLKAEQKNLISILKSTDNEELRFALIAKIAGNLRFKKHSKALISFLNSITESSPKSIYNGYWFLMLANEYMELREPEAAEIYFEKIVNSRNDIIVQEKSIKYAALQNLVKICSDHKKLAVYYSTLITDFYENINAGYSYFMLAQTYEKLEEWNLAIQMYAKFLSLRQFDVIIPGISDSYAYARKIIDYNSSSKNWTFKTLDQLISAIKFAIKRMDHGALERYRSKVYFFAMSWKQEPSDIHTPFNFNLRPFLHSEIQIAREVDPSSTPYEAYLKTTGWSQYARTWYFYFKKINFPADPAINGRWEWAGIYYGEKL